MKERSGETAEEGVEGGTEEDAGGGKVKRSYLGSYITFESRNLEPIMRKSGLRGLRR